MSQRKVLDALKTKEKSGVRTSIFDGAEIHEGANVRIGKVSNQGGGKASIAKGAYIGSGATVIIEDIDNNGDELEIGKYGYISPTAKVSFGKR